jgi:hypothetical protein
MSDGAPSDGYESGPPPPAPSRPPSKFFAPTPRPPSRDPAAPQLLRGGGRTYVLAPVDRSEVGGAGFLLILAGVACAIGCFLTWVRVADATREIKYNGFTQLAGQSGKDGPLIFVLAAALAALGAVMMMTRRLVDIAVLSIICGALIAWRAITNIRDLTDAIRDTTGATLIVHQGPGLYVIVASGVFGIAGGIVALVQRRTV